jgi:hypothetical protein
MSDTNNPLVQPFIEVAGNNSTGTDNSSSNSNNNINNDSNGDVSDTWATDEKMRTMSNYSQSNAGRNFWVTLFC